MPEDIYDVTQRWIAGFTQARIEEDRRTVLLASTRKAASHIIAAQLGLNGRPWSQAGEFFLNELKVAREQLDYAISQAEKLTTERSEVTDD